MKKYVLLLITLLSLILLNACTDVIVEPKWIITVEGLEVKTFSSIEYAKLNTTNLTLEQDNSSSNPINKAWKGVLLDTILDYLDVDNFSSITLISTDGQEYHYSKSMIHDTSSIMATSLYNKNLDEEDGVIFIFVSKQSELVFIHNVRKMIVFDE